MGEPDRVVLELVAPLSASCLLPDDDTIVAAQHCSADDACLRFASPPRNTRSQGERMGVKVSMKVNGKAVAAEMEERTLLVSFIREQLRLTGTHVGCDTAQCGA